MSTPIHQTQTQLAVDSLKWAHNWLLKVNPSLYEEQWVTMMFDHGYRYAKIFAMSFAIGEERIEEQLIKSKPESGEPNNWFWMWWKIKWMQDDWQYITNKVYNQPISYEQYKTYMQNCETLEHDLLNLLHSKKNI
ncbi:MAG: hypothetical protein EAZ35_02295 [Sphingobacteriia bacterium]|nr:MAG: hypothetical protein EAZ35_02295 [Sphingobacteriia bacterium]